MRLHIIEAIKNPCDKKFKSMLGNGSFKEADYKVSVDERGHSWTSYNMIEYSTTWSRFMKWVDDEMKKSIDPELGVFTRKHSKAVLSGLEEILSRITEEAVSNMATRFQTMWD